MAFGSAKSVGIHIHGGIDVKKRIVTKYWGERNWGNLGNRSAECQRRGLSERSFQRKKKNPFLISTDISTYQLANTQDLPIANNPKRRHRR